VIGEVQDFSSENEKFFLACDIAASKSESRKRSLQTKTKFRVLSSVMKLGTTE
jgi:hypothetical protein